MRNSNIEILRIICILMIVSMHVFGEFQNQLRLSGIAALSINNAICNLGVSVFMLISGFYGIKFNSQKIFRLWNITLFWSLIFCFLRAEYSPKEVVSSAFPIFTGKYWFLTDYIIICFLAPYIEQLTQGMNQARFKVLLAILLVFFVLAPSFLLLEIMRDTGKGLINMLLLYLVGRYISKYELHKDLTRKRWGGGISVLCDFYRNHGFCSILAYEC